MGDTVAGDAPYLWNGLYYQELNSFNHFLPSRWTEVAMTHLTHKRRVADIDTDSDVNEPIVVK